MEQATLLAPVEPPQPADSGIPSSELHGMWKFRVNGAAVPQGSWVAFIHPATGHAMAKPSNEAELYRWRNYVGNVARGCRPAWLREPWDGPIYIALAVCRARSPRDFLADGVTLRAGARRYPDTAPDSDKLERAIFDALTGIAFTNDARVVTNLTTQRFGGPGERAHVNVDIGFLNP